MAEHFSGWQPGQRMHAHTGKCIKCGRPDGDSVIHVTLTLQVGRLSLQHEGVGSRLCPQCKAKYLPLTPAMNSELNRLGSKLWRDLRKRGCPCCEAGLDWFPTDRVH